MTPRPEAIISACSISPTMSNFTQAIFGHRFRSGKSNVTNELRAFSIQSASAPFVG